MANNPNQELIQSKKGYIRYVMQHLSDNSDIFNGKKNKKTGGDLTIVNLTDQESNFNQFFYIDINLKHTKDKKVFLNDSNCKTFQKAFKLNSNPSPDTLILIK